MQNVRIQHTAGLVCKPHGHKAVGPATQKAEKRGSLESRSSGQPGHYNKNFMKNKQINR